MWFGTQPLDFDEVTKCDEKQLNKKNTETKMISANQEALCPFEFHTIQESFLLDADLQIDSVCLSTVLCLDLTVCHTGE